MASISIDSAASKPVARRVLLQGRVQGLGIRPLIHRLATSNGLAGSVHNSSRGVEIALEGIPQAIESFRLDLIGSLPPSASLDRLEIEPSEFTSATEFVISHEPTTGPLATPVPPDLGVCPDCILETTSAGNRRHDYPFTSCTNCGPRFSIIERMPYERADTTMSRFALCDDCRREYGSPPDRRFHAQTNACPLCGPHVWCQDAEDRTIGHRAEAVALAVTALTRGEIVAMRGVGGYQLLVDATNHSAVTRLRERKHRLAKPLAVLVRNLQQAETIALLTDAERRELLRPQNPIVVCDAKPGTALSPAIHPDLNRIGLLLPTTPLHQWLADACQRPLVCTSANREGEPLEFEPAAAQQRLQGICDLWLHHDRPIKHPIDDSVVQLMGDRSVTIRLARGLAPLTLPLADTPPIIALGGHLKGAIAWSNGAQAVLGPHLGDQATLGTRQRTVDQLAAIRELYRFEPELYVHDAHPDYFTSQWAAQQTTAALAVHHHHAHVVAGMLEQGWLDRPVLGFAWDGTGYGEDGGIWGGECLQVDGQQCRRLAHLRSIPLPGGEAAIHQPWRIAVAALEEAVGASGRAGWNGIGPGDQQRALLQILNQPQLVIRSCGAGRLFDLAAVIITGRTLAEYDGQLAMLMEALADRAAEGSYRFPLDDRTPARLDWRPLVTDLWTDRLRGVDVGTMAMRFHRSLAEGILRVCRRHPSLPLVFCGGVFQNRLLVELTSELLSATSAGARAIAWPGALPTNDGGLAAGQLALGMMSYVSGNSRKDR